MDSNKRNVGAAGLSNDVAYAASLAEAVTPNAQAALRAAVDSHLSQEAAASPRANATPSIDSAFDRAGAQTGKVGNGATIDDTRPSLEGQGEPKTWVNVYDNGKLLGTAYVGQFGDWSIDLPRASALDTGEHVFTVADASGVTSEPFVLNIEIPESSKPVIDTVFDSVGVTGDVSNGGTTDDAKPTLHGHGEPGLQVFLYDNNVLAGSAFIQPDGSWTLEPDQSLAPGEHVFTVVKDRIASDPFVLTVGDTEAAIKPVIDSVFDDFGVVGEIANCGTTDDATPTLRGHGQPFSAIIVYDHDVRVGSAYTGPDGSWSFNVSSQLAQGEHVFTVVGTTVAGVGISSEPFTLTVSAPDAPKPTIDSAFDDFGVVGEIANGGSTDDTTPTLRGHGQPFSAVTVYDHDVRVGSAYTGPDGSWSFNVSNQLALGEHSFTVVGAGVTSEPFTLTVSAPDSPKPTIDSAYDDFGQTAVIGNGGNTDDATPTLRGHGQPFSAITVYDHDVRVGSAYTGADGSWSFNVGNRLAQGEHSFTVAGAGVTSEPFLLIVDAPDLSKPSIDSAYDNFGLTADVLNGGSTDDNTPSLVGRGEPNTSLTIYDNGRYLTTVNVDGSGNWRASGSLSPALSVGEHVLTVAGAGGSSDAFNLTVVAPDSANLAIDAAFDDFGATGVIGNGGTTDDTSPKISGHGGLPNTEIYLYEGSAYLGYAIVKPDGSWSLYPNGPLALGEHTFTVVGAGDARSEPFVLHVTAPDSAKPVIDTVIDNIGTVEEILNGATTDDARPTFHGHGEPNTDVYLYDNGAYAGGAKVGADGSWTLNVNQRLAAGEHEFTVSGAGVTSEPFSLTIENAPEAPRPVIESAVDDVGVIGVIENGGSTDDIQPIFHGHAEPDASIIVFYDNDKYIGSSSVQSDGSWTFELVDANQSIVLRPGDHSITASTDGVTFSEPFVLHVTADAAVAGQPAAEGKASLQGLSLNDVLTSGESELFAAEHAKDSAEPLALQIDTHAFAAESSVVHDAGVMAAAVPPPALIMQHEELLTA